MFTYVFDAASETLVCLQHLSISLSTKTNLKQRPVCTETSLEYTETQTHYILGWKGNSK